VQILCRLDPAQCRMVVPTVADLVTEFHILSYLLCDAEVKEGKQRNGEKNSLAEGALNDME